MLHVHVFMVVTFHFFCMGHAGKHGGGQGNAPLQDFATVHGGFLLDRTKT